MELLYTSCALVATFVNVVIQVTLVRYFQTGLFRSVCYSFVFGLAACSVACVFLWSSVNWWPDTVELSLIAVSTYVAMSYCYFHFVNLGETARRIRLLREISCFSSPPTVSQLIERYGPSEIYARRIQRLLQNQQIKIIDGSYVLGKPGMSLISRIMLTLRRLVFAR